MAHFIFDKEGNKLDSLTPKSKIEEPAKPAKQTRGYSPINIRDLANRYLYKENVAQLEEYAKNLLASSDITEERLKNRTINYAFNKNLLDFINSAIMPKDDRLKQYKNFLQLVQVKNTLKKKGSKKDARDVAALATHVNKDGTVKNKLTPMQRAKLHQDTLARTVNWDDWAERLLPENMFEEYKQAVGNRLNINKRDTINSILKSHGVDEDVLPAVTLIIGNKKGKSYYTINDWREHIDNVNKYKDIPHYDFDEVTRQWKPKSELTPEDVNDEDDRPADWWQDPIYDNPEDYYTQEDIDRITATLKANPKYHHEGNADMPLNVTKFNRAFTDATGIDEPQLKYNRKNEENVQTKAARTKYGKTLTNLGFKLKPGPKREKTVKVSKEVLDVLLNTHDTDKNKRK